jgi:chorismate-pyruvate lyase
MPPTIPDLHTLAGLFYPRLDDLGQFVEVRDDEMPPVYQRLLAHDGHMTVTVEEFHHSPVNVSVHDKRKSAEHYSRKILLSRKSDGRVVQFGIVRLTLAYLSPEVQAEIISETTPLGRVLIQHNVLRQVHLVSLWRVTPGPDLQRLFHLDGPQVTYGRTALIECDHEPAVELIEIVTPEP